VEQSLYNKSQRYFNYSTFTTNTGSSISTLLNKTEYTPLYNNYNNLDDYYFVSKSEPDKPVLQINTQQNDTSSLFIENMQFLQNSVTALYNNI
jgi:hypothetical protein